MLFRLLVKQGFEMQRLESPEKEEREARSHEHRTALSDSTVARTPVRLDRSVRAGDEDSRIRRRRSKAH